MAKVKVRILYPLAFGDQYEAGTVVEFDEDEITPKITNGDAELVERATKAPGERRTVKKPS